MEAGSDFVLRHVSKRITHDDYGMLGKWLDKRPFVCPRWKCLQTPLGSEEDGDGPYICVRIMAYIGICHVVFWVFVACESRVTQGVRSMEFLKAQTLWETEGRGQRR